MKINNLLIILVSLILIASATAFEFPTDATLSAPLNNTISNFGNADITTQFVLPNTKMIAGYLFKTQGDSTDIFLDYSGSDTDVSYNGSGVYYNGSGIIDIPDINYLPTENHSACLRFNSNALGTANDYLSDDSGSVNVGGFQVRATTLTLESNVNGDMTSASYSFSTGTDYDICYTSNSTNVSFYVNGINIGTNAYTFLNDITFSHLGHVGLNATAEYIYVYNGTLTDEEITLIANEGDYTTNIRHETNESINLTSYDFIATNYTPQGLTESSISAWINVNKGSGWVVGSQKDGNEEFLFGLDSGSDLIFSVNGCNVESLQTSSFWLNSWKYITATLDTNGTTKLYIDGVLDETAQCGATVIDVDSGKVYIGNYDDINSPFTLTGSFNGSIDNVMLFDRSLTADEVNSIYDVQLNDLSLVDLSFSIYDYDTNVLLNQTAIINIVNYFKANTSNGSLILEDTVIFPGDIGIYTSSDGYLTNQKVITYTDQTSFSVDVYLKNESNPKLGKLFVYVFDQNFYAVKNADTRLKRYDTDILDYVEVEQCNTNSNGECVFNIILADESYIITSQTTIDGITATAQSSETGNTYPVDNTEIELFLDFETDYTAPDDYGLSVNAYDTGLVGNTSNLNADFIDVNGNSHTVCIGYFYTDGFSEELADEECTIGSSGTVAFGSAVTLNRTYTWTSEIYTKVDDVKYKIYYSYRYPKEKSFANEFAIYLNPLMIVLIGILLGFALNLKNIIIFPIGMIPLIILYGIFKPLVFTLPVIGILIFLCVMLIYIGRKESSNEGT